jgi:hypothetical protein
MPVNQPTRSDLDQHIRHVCSGLQTAFDNLQVLKQFIDDQSVESMQVSPEQGGWGYTLDDVTKIKNLVAQVAALRGPGAFRDTIEFARQVGGINLVRR